MIEYEMWKGLYRSLIQNSTFSNPEKLDTKKKKKKKRKDPPQKPLRDECHR